jgi:hypothetical protein
LKDLAKVPCPIFTWRAIRADFQNSILATLMLKHGELTGVASILGFGCRHPCPALLAGTQYWLVAQQPDAMTSDLWNQTIINGVHGNFAFNLLDSATGRPWSPTASTTIFQRFSCICDRW